MSGTLVERWRQAFESDAAPTVVLSRQVAMTFGG